MGKSARISPTKESKQMPENNQTSEKQRKANRLNAQKSTGPTSPGGKARSCLNAARHGFTGQVLIMSDEDRKCYDAFCLAIVKDLRPKGAMEIQFAHAVADDFWRRNRMKGIEEGILSFGPIFNRIEMNADNPQIDHAARQVLAVIRDPKQFALLSLYGQRLDRAIEKNLTLLRKLQAERQAERDLELEMAAGSQTTASSETTEESGASEAATAPNGFVFSTTEIDRHRHRLNARKALNTIRATPPPRPMQPAAAMPTAA
jgi:hypothetical protein